MSSQEKHQLTIDFVIEHPDGSNYNSDFIAALKKWLSDTRKNWKGNNLIAKIEYGTIDWAIDELIEGLDR